METMELHKEIKYGDATAGTASFGYNVQPSSQTYFRHFRSLTELDECKVNKGCADYWRELSAPDHGYGPGYGGPMNWFGFTGGFPRMQEFIRTGWAAGLKDLLAKGKLLMPEAVEVAGSLAQRKRRRRVQGETGIALDMDRVWQGNLPTAWTQLRHEQRIAVSPKNVALFINLAASAGVGADQLMWRSAVAVTLLDLLIKGGYSVSIDVGCTQRNSYMGVADTSILSVRIKEYGGQMTMGQLAAACSPGFFRTYLFKAIMSRTDKQATMGLGSPLGHNTELIPWHIRQDRDAGARVVVIDSNVHSESTARTLVLSVLEQLKKEVVHGTAHR